MKNYNNLKHMKKTEPEKNHRTKNTQRYITNDSNALRFEIKPTFLFTNFKDLKWKIIL